MYLRILFVLLYVLGTTASCGTSGSDPTALEPAAPPPAPPTSIESVEITEVLAVSETIGVGAAASPLAVGEATAVSAGETVTMGVDVTVSLSAIARDAEGNEVDGARFRWVSDGESIRINPTTGLVTAESPGQSVVTVSADGITSGEIQFSVTAKGIPSLILLFATPVNSDGRAEIGVFGTATVTALVTDQPTMPDDERGDPVPSVQVNFQVSDPNLGTISPIAQTSVSGIAIATFVAADRGGTAVITATAETISAFISIQILPAAPVGIQFQSAEPQVIGIKGAGQQETSVVTFVVTDSNGNPTADGTKVCFELRGPGGLVASEGGASILPTEASTAGFGTPTAGQVQTTLQSGTVPGPARIIATVSNTDSCTPIIGTIRTESAPVSIGGGVPDLAHFSLSLDPVNIASFFGDPRGSRLDGTEATLTTLMADQFGNFNVLEGTSVSFIIEAGSIDRSNTLGDEGNTTVTIRTQAPPPIDRGTGADVSTPFSFPPTVPCAVNVGTGCNVEDGFVTIVALAKGQECFNDKNGDGLFTLASGAQDEFDVITRRTCDIGEPFINANDSVLFVGNTFQSIVNGALTTVTVAAGDANVGKPKFDPNEVFIDVNQNGVWDGPNGEWDGVETEATIWRSINIIFSGEPRHIEVVDPATGLKFPSLAFCLNPGDVQGMEVRVSDSNDVNGSASPPLGNRPMGGSTITITTTAGELANAGPFSIPGGAGPFSAGFSIANALEITTGATEVLAQAASISVVVTWNVPNRGPTTFGPVIVSGKLEGTDPDDCFPFAPPPP